MKCNAFGDFILPAGFMIIALSILTMPIGLIIDEDKTDRLETLKAEAIERGYALYCPKDGRFEWKGECDVGK